MKRVEAFREEAGGAQHYFPPTPDGSRPGMFYAHLCDMNAMPIYTLEAIAYHEGVPGHHMQIAIAQELKGIPKFRTQYGYTAYQEGWGLYSEALAKDMGFYVDPVFGLWPPLGRDLARDASGGRHGHPLEGLDRGAGGEVFPRQLCGRGGAIESEMRRYFVWPGQATATRSA